MNVPGCVIFSSFLPKHFLGTYSSVFSPMCKYPQIVSSIKENPKLRAAAEEMRKQGVKVGDAISEALKSMEESDLMRAVCFFDHKCIQGSGPYSRFFMTHRLVEHLLLYPQRSHLQLNR